MKSNLTVFDHPLIHHKLAIIRNELTGTKDFRQSVEEIANLMAYEVTRGIPTVDVVVKTPCGLANTKMIAKQVVIVPILRAGVGMIDGITSLIPTAKVGFLGLYRDEETLEPKEYYCKFPKNIEEAFVLLVDPMLATGGSVVHALDVLNRYGVKDENIKYVGVVGAPEGVKKVHEKHPNVDIFLASLDEKLNEHGYIVPGLGDCGDRLFGTK